MDIDLGIGFLKPKVAATEPSARADVAGIGADVISEIEFTTLMAPLDATEATVHSETAVPIAEVPLVPQDTIESNIRDLQTEPAPDTRLENAASPEPSTVLHSQPAGVALPAQFAAIVNIPPTNLTAGADPAHQNAASKAAPSGHPAPPVALPLLPAEQKISTLPVEAKIEGMAAEPAAAESPQPKPALVQTNQPSAPSAAQSALFSKLELPAEARAIEPKTISVQGRENRDPQSVVPTAASSPNGHVVFATPSANAEPSFVDTTAEFEMPVSIRMERISGDSQQLIQQTHRPVAPVATQISGQIQQQLTNSSQQVIELRLDPPELGRVVIHINTSDQTVAAQVTAERPETVELMRRHSEVLAQTLEKAGFSQSNLSFQQGTAQKNHQDSEQFQGLALLGEPIEADPSAPIPRAVDGRLDIRL